MAVKGAVLGDIIGAQFEFDRPKNLDWKNVPLLEDGQGLGFTDDLAADFQFFSHKFPLLFLFDQHIAEFPYSTSAASVGQNDIRFIFHTDMRICRSHRAPDQREARQIVDIITHINDFLRVDFLVFQPVGEHVTFL